MENTLLTLPKGLKIRDDIDRDTYSTITIIYCKETNSFVMLDRLDNRRRYRKAFPGGKKLYSETAIQCAARETEEETGIRVNVEDLIPFHISKPYWYDRSSKDPAIRARHNKYAIYFLLVVDSEVELISEDVDSSKESNPQWYTVDEMQSLANEFGLYQAVNLSRALEMLGINITLTRRDLDEEL